MSRYEWIECETLDKVIHRVWEYVWVYKQKKVESPYFFSVKLKNYDELYIVIHALIILSEGMRGKALSDQHTERVKPQILSEIKALKEKLWQLGYIDEALESISEINSAVKQKSISTADEHAVKISNFVYKELLDNGTSNTRAKNIKSFIKSAMIAIVKDRTQYEADFLILSKYIRECMPTQSNQNNTISSSIYYPF